MEALTKIDLPGLKKFKSGKVREVFDLDDKLLLVASDRISAFDCIMPNGIPHKGMILNQLSAWWFNRISFPQVVARRKRRTPHDSAWSRGTS